jgi:sortase A
MPEAQPAAVSETSSSSASGRDVFDSYISRDDETYYADAEDPFIEIDGSIYAGILSIPGLSVELPVYDELSYDNLKNSPCRYKGSVKKGNIIIAAHNYSSHFGGIPQMITGDVICFTDAAGYVREYSVIQTETMNGNDVAAMENGSEEWDLTIFTCSISGVNRIAVRASLI